MNVPISNGQQNKTTGINTNTGISMGVLIVLITGIIYIVKGQTDAKNDLSLQNINTKNELSTQIGKLENKMNVMEGRVTALENAKNVWTLAEMFKWAVHLQQLNKDPKKLQAEGLVVPEPEVTNGK